MAIPALQFPPTVDDASTLFTAVNNAVTTLAVSISGTDTSIQLTDASALPATGGFVSIGSEVIHYVSKTGNTLNTCTRGADGTANVPHTAGDTVSMRVIAIHHNRLLDAIVALQTYVLTIGEASGMVKEITQAGHGFVVGDVLRHNGTQFVKAQADSAANAEVIGIVVEYVDINTFKIQAGGYTDAITGMTANTVYYLSPTVAGALTATEPTSVGHVSKPLYLAMTTGTGYIFNWRGILITPSNGVFQTFGNGDLSGNAININHNLGRQYVIVSVANGSDVVTQPTSITYTDGNNLQLNFTGMTPLVGTWKVVIN